MNSTAGRAASDAGVNRFQGASWWASPYENDMFGGKVFQIRTTPEGRVWFATKNGISWFDGKSWHSVREKDGLPDRYILSLLVTSGGEVWFGTISSGVGVNSASNLE